MEVNANSLFERKMCTSGLCCSSLVPAPLPQPNPGTPHCALTPGAWEGLRAPRCHPLPSPELVAPSPPKAVREGWDYSKEKGGKSPETTVHAVLSCGQDPTQTPHPALQGLSGSAPALTRVHPTSGPAHGVLRPRWAAPPCLWLVNITKNTLGCSKTVHMAPGAMSPSIPLLLELGAVGRG